MASIEKRSLQVVEDLRADPTDAQRITDCLYHEPTRKEIKRVVGPYLTKYYKERREKKASSWSYIKKVQEHILYLHFESLASIEIPEGKSTELANMRFLAALIDNPVLLFKLLGFWLTRNEVSFRTDIIEAETRPDLISYFYNLPYVVVEDKAIARSLNTAYMDLIDTLIADAGHQFVVATAGEMVRVALWDMETMHAPSPDVVRERIRQNRRLAPFEMFFENFNLKYLDDFEDAIVLILKIHLLAPVLFPDKASECQGMKFRTSTTPKRRGATEEPKPEKKKRKPNH